MTPLLEKIENMRLNNILVYMGQNYDHNMAEQF